MSLLDRLRPKWHHADPEVRASAVRELGREDQELLGAVARHDEDARVRRIAVKKLENAQVLLELAQTDENEGVRSLAAERAGSILAALAISDREPEVCEDALSRLSDPKHLATAAMTAFHPTVRLAALSRLSDEKALGEVTTKASDISIRREALGRISDLSVLRRIAASDSPSELALGALERIDDPDSLWTIAEDRTAQKSVRQRAQAKLDLMVTDDHPSRIKQRRERQLQLCLTVEALATGKTTQEAAERLRDAEKNWDNLARRTEPWEHVEQRFRKACQIVLDEITREQRRKTEKERRDSELEESLSARLALCEKVETLEGDGALGELDEARAAWDRLGPLAEGQGEALTERFSKAAEGCRSRHDIWQARRAFQSKLEQLVNEAEELAQSARLSDVSRNWAALEKRWAKLQASPDSSSLEEPERTLRQRLVRAGEQLVERQKEDRERQEQQREENLARLRELWSRLDGMAKSEQFNVREADRELRALPVAWKIGPLPSSESRKEWEERLSDARQQLARRFQQHKDSEEWRRWANADVQQQLIKQAEALLDAEDLGNVAKELRRIQEEWKRFGTAPRDQSQALWDRFRKVRDDLRDRCDAYFSDNLKKKEAICETVEALADSTQWKETAEAIKQIQAEWKRIGPVPQNKSEALWTRFRKPCDRFFEARNEHFGRLKQEREENARKKAELCEKVEALSDSTDWDRVTEEIKQIQAEWKRIGPVFQNKSEALWNRFRQACDHFFDRRKRRGDLDLEEKLQRADLICVELESLVSSLGSPHAPPPDTVGQKIRESWTEWCHIGSFPPAQAGPLNQRFRKAWERIIATCPESLNGTELDPRTTRKKREKLCARVERLVETHADATGEPFSGNLAEKLKHALAASTFGGSAAPRRKKDWRAAMEEAERVKANWERLGPIIGEVDQSLDDRFHKAYSSFLGLRRRETTPRSGNTETHPSK